MRRSLPLFAAILVLVLLPGTAMAASDELKKSGTVTIDQFRVSFLISGNIGGGELTYQGKTYKFDIGGLGIGGIGASSIEATGTVYNLENLSDFEGMYGQARTGIVFIDKSTGKLWLENTSGVYLELNAKQEGLALTMGADAIGINLK
jgi:hypothetical protein